MHDLGLGLRIKGLAFAEEWRAHSDVDRNDPSQGHAQKPLLRSGADGVGGFLTVGLSRRFLGTD